MQTMKIFPEHSLIKEEFEKIRNLAIDCCNGEAGRKGLMAIQLHVDFGSILQLLEETDEMRRILANGEPFPAARYPDIEHELKLVHIPNAVLTTQEVLQVDKVVVLAGAFFSFMLPRAEKYPLLHRYLLNLKFEKEIPEAIRAVMDESGFVLSGASAELGRIRKLLSRKRIESEQIYLAVIQKYRKSGWLSEAEESWRNGRRVVSIVAEQKRSARGIVHDISSTGKTCFIEPEEAIAINQLILSLEEEERAEIKRILFELTAILRRFYPALKAYYKLLEVYDIIYAKAMLAVKMDAFLPYVDPEPKIQLLDARHPLLYLYNKASAKKTVPFSLKLSGEERILVISGPNAGGKTVCMKTIGLLQMMLQSGFLVTADANSRFGIFSNLLVDIGDSQSLEFELSTYSSRLRHMKVFLQQASANTLFLIDEFGTGTDPVLGGALAEAILEELNSKKAVGIITTHYMNLKILADRTKGIINGSMAFDARKLEPLFRLEVGKPGSSYTFVVAERSGLPFSVINRARKKVKKNTLLLEELLNKVEKEKSEIARLMEINQTQEKRLKELVNKYEKNVVHQEQKMEQQEERARLKELRLSQQMEDKFQRFVKDWREAKNKKTVLEKYNRKLQERKNTLSEKDLLKQEETLAYNRIHIKKGAQVRLRNGRVTGIVQSVKEDRVEVLFGNVKTLAEMNQLILVDAKTVPEKETAKSMKTKN